MFLRAAVIFLSLATAMAVAVPAQSSSGDLSTAIETFMAKQFPDAHSHFWVVNGAQWQTEDEVVIDVNTVVVNRAGQEPTENRFLLLVVAGEFKAAQNIPLDSKVECQPEQQA